MENSDTASILKLDVEEASPSDVDVNRLKEGISSENNRIRAHATRLSYSITRQDLEVGFELTPTLLSVVKPDEQAAVLKGVFGALALVAEERPEELTDVIGSLLDGLVHDLPLIRMLAARAVRPVAAEFPEQFAPYSKMLLNVLERDIEMPMEQVDPLEQDIERSSQLQSISKQIKHRENIVEGIVTNLVAEIAKVDSTALVSDADVLIGLLGDSSINMRTPVVAAVASIAEDHPEAATDAVDPLTDLLDANDVSVVLHAIRALGFIGDESGIKPLRAVAEDDRRHDAVSSLADDTAGWIENQEA